MTEREILQHIDNGANYYVSIFGEAVHMDKVDQEYYSYVKPKAGEQGISFIYNVHIENLSPEQKKAVIDEMKSMNMPIWLDLLVSDETASIFSGKERKQEQTKPDEDVETYLAILPEEKRECPINSDQVLKVHTADEFAAWAQTANDVLAGGNPDLHPVHHFPLCEKGIMKCYTMYSGGMPVSVAAIIDNHGIASLEFVATVPEARRRGFARAVCAKAVWEAFSDGASIITVRAADSAAAKLYQSIGFRTYGG